MICNIESHIKNIYYEDYKFFFSKPNVVGIGYGYKNIKGINTCELSIHVLVVKKMAANCLPSNGLIPPVYKGIKTDVIESGVFTAESNPMEVRPPDPQRYLTRVRPIEPGYCMSVGGNRTTGTFGYIVTDNKQVSPTYCLLSVNKTFADFNRTPIGAPIIQPAHIWGGIAPQDIVATLLRYQPLRLNEFPKKLEDFNAVDASVASYQNVGEVQLINPLIPKIGVPHGIGVPILEGQVQWTGCFGGYNKSIIKTLGLMVEVQYDNDTKAWFKDVIGFQAFRIPFYDSDSGALVCNDKKDAIGLLFGRSFYYGLVCNIINVLEALDVKLLTI